MSGGGPLLKPGETPEEEQLAFEAAERIVREHDRQIEIERRRLLDWPAGSLPGSIEHERLRLAAARHLELEERRVLNWPAGPVPGSKEHNRLRLEAEGRCESKRKRDEEELPKQQAHASVRACI